MRSGAMSEHGQADSGCDVNTTSQHSSVAMATPASTATLSATTNSATRPADIALGSLTLAKLGSAASNVRFDGGCLEHITAKSGGNDEGLNNKIEQAMDLVKSHLMFAVREEVIVLRENINKLVARNNQLERENALLRRYATPNTLSQLPAGLPQAASTSTGTASTKQSVQTSIDNCPAPSTDSSDYVNTSNQSV